jgi:hypothetical protein
MFLSYPMGPALNISTDVTARDLDAWVGSGLTCLENGGMTHPVHIISFLTAKAHNSTYQRLAERALNGTMRVRQSLSPRIFCSSALSPHFPDQRRALLSFSSLPCWFASRSLAVILWPGWVNNMS